MLRQSPVLAAVIVGIVTFAPALGTLGVEQVRGESGLGTPLAREMVADERPPPSTAAPATASPGTESPNPESPLAEIPLRTRHPSVTFLPGLPQVGLADPASKFADVDETQVIQLVYDTYSRYSEREDGERVEFELDGFRTVYRPQFGKVAHYPDLMTLGTDWEIRTTLREHQVDLDEPTMWYEAEWVPIPNRAERMPDLLGKSVLDIIAIGAPHLPHQRRIVAITSYRVHVSFLGRSQTYRATVRWRIDEEQNLEFSVADNVVPEVGWAVGEGIRPAAEVSREEVRRPFDRATASSTTPQCVSHTWNTKHSPQSVRYNSLEHSSGRHEAVYIGKFDCSCRSDCFTTCDAGFAVEACQDYGTLTAPQLEHRATPKTKDVDGTEQAGHLHRPQCASGLGCFVQSCPGGACETLSTQLSATVASVTYTTSTPTLLEASLTSTHGCGLCTETDAGDSQTPSDGPIVQGCAPDCGSPIVVDLDRGGFRFTDLDGGVRFDLDGDGHAESISWVAPGSGDGWLVLDRDGDGMITTGAELFGNFTPQPPSDEPHGYAALAVFDQPAAGGDGDGAITPADAVFAELRLWIDADHDGVSRPDELISLAAAGIRAIHLDYVTSARRDEHGNELRYVSRVRLVRGMTQSADVFLLVGD